MCGIVAVRGRHAGNDALQRLKGLDCRGFEHAGIAEMAADRALHSFGSVGAVDALIDRLAHVELRTGPARIAIGHTRCGANGPLSVRAAHPLSDCTLRVTVVHNGVLDNTVELRRALEHSGHSFGSDVGGEVIPHLIEQGLKRGLSSFEAFQRAVHQLRGSWAIVALIAGSNAVFAARHHSTLVVRGTVGRFVAASDATATAGVRGPLRIFDDGTMAELGTTWRWAGAGPAPVAVADVAIAAEPNSTRPPSAARVRGLSATVAEIGDQLTVAQRIVGEIASDGAAGIGWRKFGLPTPDSVLLLGCGASFPAAQVAAGAFRLVSGIDARAEIGSEFDPALSPRFGLAVALSVSGETEDLLAALEGISTPVIAITNAPRSALARRATAVMDCDAGAQRGLAPTKTFAAELLCGIRLALAAAHARGLAPRARAATALLRDVIPQFSAAIDLGSPITDDETRSLRDAPGWLFIATGPARPYASAAAQLLTRLSGRWAGSFAAAELKRGPLALVSRGVPAVLIDDGSRRCSTARAEMTARGGHVITLRPAHRAGDRQSVEDAPWGPLELLPRLQHLALSIAANPAGVMNVPRAAAGPEAIR